MLRALLLLCCLGWLVALDFGTPDLVRADLRIGAIGADGRAVALVRFTIAPEWHIYWTNPGDSGLAPKLEWTLPRGWSATAPLHPAPKRHVDAGLVTWVHEGAPTLLVELAAPPGTPGGPVELRLDWLVCKEACIPGKTVLRDTLGGVTASPGEIAAARELLPRRAVDSGATITARRGDAGLELRVAGLRPTAFAPAEEGRFAGDLPTPEADGDGWRMRLPLAAGREAPDRLAGLLLDGGRGVAIDSAIEPAPASASAPATGIGLGTAIIAGLIGGLILNLMPCVLPVLSLKLLAMARLREAGGSPVRHAMAYWRSDCWCCAPSPARSAGASSSRSRSSSWPWPCSSCWSRRTSPASSRSDWRRPGSRLAAAAPSSMAPSPPSPPRHAVRPSRPPHSASPPSPRRPRAWPCSPPSASASPCRRCWSR
jgi:thiol:disulfide interchange protein DsbD